MKKISIVFLLGLIILGSSCKKWLDINQNPNNASSDAASYDLILPQALAYSASIESQYNIYGSQNAGYFANAGGYGSLGTFVSYAYTGNDWPGLWSNSYDNLEDYKSIIDQTDGNSSLLYYNGAAKIMSCLLYQNLVDAYNDIPYSEALIGGSNFTPKYDSAKIIYKSLADTLDNAISEIDAGITSGATSLGTGDVMFGNDMVKWKQLANTIKLRLLVEGNGKVDFSNNTFSSDGFLATDALVNPGYTQGLSQSGASQQNPRYNSLIWTYSGTPAYKVYIPSTYVFSFYDGTKLTDVGRGKAMFYQYPSTGTNRLGNQNSVPNCPDGTFWWPTTDRAPGATTGAFKGPDAGAVIITAAESYFLQAEAALKGIITAADVAALFKSGITASFNYLYQLPSGTLADGLNPTVDANDYIAANPNSSLVNFSLASTDAEKLEAIITQKYIALNMISGDQAWNDYRRTHYPTIVTSPSATNSQTFVSTLSLATRPDKLPSRIAYPTSEVSYNNANMPKSISVYTSLIFWALP